MVCTLHWRSCSRINLRAHKWPCYTARAYTSPHVTCLNAQNKCCACRDACCVCHVCFSCLWLKWSWLRIMQQLPWRYLEPFVGLLIIGNGVMRLSCFFLGNQVLSTEVGLMRYNRYVTGAAKWRSEIWIQDSRNLKIYFIYIIKMLRKFTWHHSEWSVEVCLPFRSVRIGFQTDPLFEEWPGWVWFELRFGFETVGSVEFLVSILWKEKGEEASISEFIRLTHFNP